MTIRRLTDLPPDLICHCVEYLPMVSMRGVKGVSRLFNDLFSEPEWRALGLSRGLLTEKETSNPGYHPSWLDTKLRQAHRIDQLLAFAGIEHPMGPFQRGELRATIMENIRENKATLFPLLNLPLFHHRVFQLAKIYPDGGPNEFSNHLIGPTAFEDDPKLTRTFLQAQLSGRSRRLANPHYRVYEPPDKCEYETIEKIFYSEAFTPHLSDMVLELAKTDGVAIYLLLSSDVWVDRIAKDSDSVLGRALAGAAEVGQSGTVIRLLEHRKLRGLYRDKDYGRAFIAAVANHHYETAEYLFPFLPRMPLADFSKVFAYCDSHKDALNNKLLSTGWSPKDEKLFAQIEATEKYCYQIYLKRLNGPPQKRTQLL